MDFAGGNARSAVGDRNTHAPSTRSGLEADGGILRGKLHGVGEQIADGAREHHRLGARVEAAGVSQQGNALLRRRRRCRSRDLGEQHVEVDGVEDGLVAFGGMCIQQP